MDNIILSGMLRDFAQRHDLVDDPVDKQFEQFSNYCLLKTDHYDSFDFEKVSTGDCIGIDGVAVTIGDVIIDELEDAQLFTKGQFEAKFFFTQAKTSSKFDLGDFLKFIATVKLFFGKDKDAVPPQLHNAFELKKHIYERAAKLRKLPTAELSYVYTGRFELGGTQIEKQIESEIDSLRRLPYTFSDVTWHVHDGDSIARLYRETKNDVQKAILFQRHIALPKIRGTQAAYLGVVGCKDYVRLIQKENGELNKGLFFENVRDFLGSANPVNEEIARTIHNTDERDRFAILNNGVTVVAKNVVPSGDNFELSQFQVVNGCQTSHVLFNNRDTLTDDMYITVKLIETSDVDLSGKVIATTNSQSQVTKEAFATIRPYHRSLEDFFDAMRSTGYGYYYERRPHQYDDRDDIHQNFIVSAPSLIKSFVSVVAEEPHKVHYYYGRLLIEYNKNRSSELFAEGDYPGIYFASHHIASRARSLAFKDRYLSQWGFHIAFLIKKMLAPELKKGTLMNDRRFFDVLDRINAGFDAAYRTAAQVVKSMKLYPNQNRFHEVTAAMVKELAKATPSAPRTSSTPARTTPPPKPEALLQEGNYIGLVESVDLSTKIIGLKYGPYQLSGKPKNDRALQLSPGSRAPFSIRNGVALVSAPEAV